MRDYIKRNFFSRLTRFDEFETQYKVLLADELKSYFDNVNLREPYVKYTVKEAADFAGLKRVFFIREVAALAIARTGYSGDPYCVMLKGVFEGWVIRVFHDGPSMLVARSVSEFVENCENGDGEDVALKMTPEEEARCRNTLYEDEDDQVFFLLVVIQSVSDIAYLDTLCDYGDSDIRLSCLNRLKKIDNEDARLVLQKRKYEFDRFVELIEGKAEEAGIESTKGIDFDILFDERMSDRFEQLLGSVFGRRLNK